MENRSSNVILIQPDWLEALKEDGKAWVTCKFRGQKGHHGFLRSEGTSPDGIPCVSSEDVTVGTVQSHVLEVQHPKSELWFRVVAPTNTFKSIHTKPISQLDVTPGGLGVSCSTDNQLLVWETTKGVIRRSLDGHLGEVYTCLFFPSGVVVLSSGADMQLRIWSAEDASNPVTMKGHTAPVTDLAIVDRGKNVISVSKDGSARLWNCGKGESIMTIATVEDEINCCDLGVTQSLNTDELPVEGEVGTSDKVLAIGGENGNVFVVGIANRSILWSKKLDSAVNAIRFMSGSEELICGCQDGSVRQFSWSSGGDTGRTIHDSDSAVQSLLVLHNDLVLVGRRDGSCIGYKRSDDKHRVTLSGSDVDPIYSIAEDGEFVYTGARDGAIRKYSIKEMTH